MSVSAKTEKVTECINKLMNEYIELIGGMEIMNLTTDEFKAIKSTMELIKLTNELMLEQADVLDEISYKLDLLIPREEKAE